MKYDFDKITDRRNTGSLKWDVSENELPMWVADMDFEVAPAIKREILRTVESQMSIISLMTALSVMDPEGDLVQRSMSCVWFLLLCFWY